MWSLLLCYKQEDDFLLFWDNSLGFSNFLKTSPMSNCQPHREMQPIKNVSLPLQQVLGSPGVWIFSGLCFEQRPHLSRPHAIQNYGRE